MNGTYDLTIPREQQPPAAGRVPYDPQIVAEVCAANRPRLLAVAAAVQRAVAETQTKERT